MLGWNPGGEDEIFSRDELIQLFDENRLSKSPAAFDQKKMDWMSNEYIKNADLATIFEMAKPFLEEAGRLTDKAEKLVELYKPQMKSVDEIVPLTDLFFSDFPELTEAEKEAAILRAEAQKEKMIREAEGQAEAILKVQKANADGLRFLKDAGADETVLALKSFEALTKVADGKATKIIIPSELQNVAGTLTALAETVKTEKKETADAV